MFIFSFQSRNLLNYTVISSMTYTELICTKSHSLSKHSERDRLSHSFNVFLVFLLNIMHVSSSLSIIYKAARMTSSVSLVCLHIFKAYSFGSQKGCFPTGPSYSSIFPCNINLGIGYRDTLNIYQIRHFTPLYPVHYKGIRNSRWL